MIVETDERQKRKMEAHSVSGVCEIVFAQVSLIEVFVYSCWEVHSMHSYVTGTYLCISLFICI